MLLNYTDTGTAGTPVVLLHGMAGSTRYWDKFIPLVAKGHRIVALDLLGFGRSPKPTTVTYDYEAHVESIIQTLNHIGIARPFVLIGHSMGGLIALRLAATYPADISKLLVIAMPIYTSANQAHMAITSSSLLKQWAYYGLSSKILCNAWCRFLRPVSVRLAPIYLPQLTRAAAQDSVLHTWQAYSQSLHNIIETQHVLDDSQHYKKPITLVYGSRDIPTALSQIHPSNFNIVTLPGTHQILNEHPDKIAKLM